MEILSVSGRIFFLKNMTQYDITFHDIIIKTIEFENTFQNGEFYY